MGWGYGNTVGGAGIWMSIFSIVILVDLILLGVWLWKQVNKK